VIDNVGNLLVVDHVGERRHRHVVFRAAYRLAGKPMQHRAYLFGGIVLIDDRVAGECRERARHARAPTADKPDGAAEGPSRTALAPLRSPGHSIPAPGR